jgi:hypothetical protein
MKILFFFSKLRLHSSSTSTSTGTSSATSSTSTGSTGTSYYCHLCTNRLTANVYSTTGPVRGTS